MTKLQDFYQRGDYPAAIKVFNTSLKHTNDDCLFAAASHFHLENLDECLEILEPLYNVFSDTEEYLSLLGATYRKLGQLQKALDIFNRGQQVCQVSPPFLNNFANLLADLGQFSQSESILSALLVENPQYIDAQVNLTRTKSLAAKASSIKQPESFPTFVTGTPLDPLYEAFSDLEKLYTVQNFLSKDQTNIETKRSLSTSVTNISGLVRPHLETDQALAEMRKLALINKQTNPLMTINLCNSLVTKGIPQSSLYTIVAEAYINLGKLDLSEKYYLMAYANGQQTLEVLVNLSQLANIRSSFDEASNFISQAKHHFPNNEQIELVQKQILERMELRSPTSLSSTKPFPL